MKRKTSVSSAIALILLATGAAAQERPDYSGSWTMAPSPAGPGEEPGGSLGSGWGPAFSIRQDANVLTIERAFFTRGDLQPALKFRYPLDGAEIRNRILMGRGIQEDVSTAVWVGDKFVITTVHSFPDPDSHRIATTEVIRTLSLQPPPAGRDAWPPSLLIETTRGGVPGASPSTVTTIYTKS